MLREYITRLRASIGAWLSPQIADLKVRVEPYVAQVRARYEKLEPRERLLVQVAGVLIAIFLLYSLVYSPIVNLTDGLDDEIALREHDLANVRRMATNYAELKTELSAAENSTVTRNRDFSLFSVVETSFSKSVGRDKITSITPAADKKISGGFVQYSVQLKLENVDLAQIVDALYAVRSLPVPVGIENLHIQRRSQNTHAYDVDITCVALGRG